MYNHHSVFARVLTLAVVLVLAGCGGRSVAAPAPTITPTAAPTATPTSTSTLRPTATPMPSLTATATPEPEVVSSLQDVEQAVVQIEAQGSFMDPEVGLQLNVVGRGSGFIVDESGIAVTNNHVVTGAAFLRVWVNGQNEPLNARILGVSECSDLAVIDIDGDGFPYFKWYGGPVAPGLEVYAAGFPLGDREFTLTSGIVSQTHANGDTRRSSVDAAIKHDAPIRRGMSGGPLVNESGQVIAVNYGIEPELHQSLAVAGDEAFQIFKQLREGKDIHSIGVNGIAVGDGEEFSGIWVASVRSGSPADRVGVRAGDIIIRLEGLVLATDGTMADYCSILRGHNPEDALSIEVARIDWEAEQVQLLEGRLNGRELEPIFSFEQELEGAVGESTGGVTYHYTTGTDDSDAIEMDVPTAWAEVSGAQWEHRDRIIGAAIVASSDIDGFYSSYSTPGVFFGASRVLAQTYDEVRLLNEVPFSDDCTYEGRFDYEDPLYTGLYDLYTNCGGVGTAVVNIAAVPEHRSFIMLVHVKIVSEADLDALDRIIRTFQVVGDLP